MTLIANILLDGIAYALILFMISVGMAMTLGLMRVVNLAHGAFAMMGGYLAATFARQLGLRIELCVVLAVLCVAMLSVPIEALLMRRFYGRTHLDQMLMTTGVMLIFVATADLLFGSGTVTVPLPDYLSGTADLGFRSTPVHRLFVIGLGGLVALILWITVERSTFGMQVRAAVDNPSTAQVIGINTTRLYAVTFAIGAGLAALGGIAGAALIPMEPTYAGKYLVIILAVVAIGGSGTLLGSLVAALLLGIVDTAAKYLVPDLSSIAFFLTMCAVLLLRPGGLMGRAVAH